MQEYAQGLKRSRVCLLAPASECICSKTAHRLISSMGLMMQEYAQGLSRCYSSLLAPGLQAAALCNCFACCTGEAAVLRLFSRPGQWQAAAVWLLWPLQQEANNLKQIITGATATALLAALERLQSSGDFSDQDDGKQQQCGCFSLLSERATI